MATAHDRGPRAVRWYRRLLRLYPAEFRETYARELFLVFEDRWREERSLGGRLVLWWHALAGLLREAPREQGHVLLQDARYALRYMRKDATTTLAAIAVLALGIGSATVVFSFANGLFLRPLPYADAARLVAVDESSPKDPNDSGEITAPNYVEIRSRTTLLGDMALWNADDASIRGDGPAERVHIGVVTASLFPVLGVRPIIGRVFTAEEDVPTGPRVVVISEELWRDHYGAAPDILARHFSTGNNSYQIVGVMPAAFHFPNRAMAWFPFRFDPAKSVRTDYGQSAIGRLAPGATVEAASAEVAGLLTAIHHEHPEADNGWRARVRPLHVTLTTEYRPALITLLIAAALLLVIACANVSNLLLATTSARVREMAVRRALGASRRRLIRQLVVESLLLGVAGGAPGVLVAYFGVPALLSLVPIDLPLWMNFAVDGRVVAFAAAVSLLTALVFGLAPSLTASGGDLTTMLRDGDRGGTSARQRRWRDGWVIAQVALSVLLLVGAGLMIRSFIALRFQPLGFDADQVLSISVDYPAKRYPAGSPARTLISDLHTQLASLPGVTSVAFGSGVPFDHHWSRYFTIEGRPLPLEQMPFVNHTVVTPGYLKTLGISIARGRDVTDADYQSPHVVIVSQAFADQYWPGENAVGKRMRFGPPQKNEPWHDVIGVAGNSRVGTLTDDDRPTVYLPFGSYDGEAMPSTIVVRSSVPPSTLERSVRARITSLDRDIAITSVSSLGVLVERASWRDRFVAWLVGMFAAMALTLAAVGLYGALSFTVTQQRREIGIRMALGASASMMRSLLVRRGLTLTGIGLCFGLVGAAMMTRLLGSQLYRVSPTDAVTFLVTPLVLLAVGWLASARPAWRATRVDPLIALRRD